MAILETSKKEYPMIPLRGTVMFPHIVLPLMVGRLKSTLALEEAFQNDRLIVLLTQKDKNQDEPKEKDIYSFGTLALIEQIAHIPQNGARVTVRGIQRVKVKKFKQTEPSFSVEVELIEEPKKGDLQVEALVKVILNQLQKILELGKVIPADILFEVFATKDPGRLSDLIAFGFNLPIETQQEVLETSNPKERLGKINVLLAKELQITQVGREIESEAHKELSKMQRDVILREQMRAIQKELGGEAGEFAELERKIKEAKMPLEVEERANKELTRLMRMGPYAPEASYIRTYLDWMIEMPWAKVNQEILDLKKAKEVLDADHYGLFKVKERMIEFLAVRKLSPQSKGPILCFVGPPGTGKTSIGKSIAKALNRKFTRISLGGIRDEAEIRGHRRTYVGALPGRIIQGIHSAKTKNPVFMLDEIDKLGFDWRGDPSSALLEALDPEQNFAFSDHYLEVPFDLSKVMFITTANILDTIPPALRDRLEVIEFSGYIEDEKYQIAKKFLLPKQLRENGLRLEDFVLSDSALKKIIREYTKEAGVRNLERELGSLARKIARQLAEKKKPPFKISEKNLEEFLGPSRFSFGLVEEKDEVGVATGLAWTEVGGEVLFIESSVMPGKGNLVLTGRLGDVMRESGQAALSFCRAHAKDWGIRANFYRDSDIHIHVPSGAIPKDGPSAGVAMATALVSALSKTPVNKEVGMTGEVTLRGKVLEIGGVKEKVLAAHRAGLKTVILPETNKKDLKDVPAKVQKDLKFIFVKNMDEVLANSLLH